MRDNVAAAGISTFDVGNSGSENERVNFRRFVIRGNPFVPAVAAVLILNLKIVGRADDSRGNDQGFPLISSRVTSATFRHLGSVHAAVCGRATFREIPLSLSIPLREYL